METKQKIEKRRKEIQLFQHILRKIREIKERHNKEDESKILEDLEGKISKL